MNLLVGDVGRGPITLGKVETRGLETRVVDFDLKIVIGVTCAALNSSSSDSQGFKLRCRKGLRLDERSAVIGDGLISCLWISSEDGEGHCGEDYEE